MLIKEPPSSCITNSCDLCDKHTIITWHSTTYSSMYNKCQNVQWKVSHYQGIVYVRKLYDTMNGWHRHTMPKQMSTSCKRIFILSGSVFCKNTYHRNPQKEVSMYVCTVSKSLGWGKERYNREMINRHFQYDTESETSICTLCTIPKRSIRNVCA